MARERRKASAMALAAVLVAGCVPSNVVGPLRRAEDERERLLVRARASGVSLNFLNAMVAPLSSKEEQEMSEQDNSCRISYLWKNGLTWTGGTFVGIAAGSTILGGIATRNSNPNAQIAFGVSGGSLAALGGILQVVAGILQIGFSDRGCFVRESIRSEPPPVPLSVPVHDRAKDVADAGCDAGDDAGAPSLRSTWGTGDDGG
jgi:hypothetical protein